jgi:hypothetical protein
MLGGFSGGGVAAVGGCGTGGCSGVASPVGTPPPNSGLASKIKTTKSLVTANWKCFSFSIIPSYSSLSLTVSDSLDINARIEVWSSITNVGICADIEEVITIAAIKSVTINAAIESVIIAPSKDLVSTTLDIDAIIE